MSKPKYGASPSTFAPFVVYCDYKPKRTGDYEPYTARLGGYGSRKEALIAITDNERAMKNPETYGGLIDFRDGSQRRYRVFKCSYEECT